MKISALFRTFLITALLFLIFWPGAGRGWVEIYVTEGQNAHDVVRVLREAGVVQSWIPIKLWMTLRRAGSKIQIGRYRFSKGRSAFWIVDDLVHGRGEKVKFVIPEGYASWQIAEKLDNLKICDGEQFKEYVLKEQLEGILFPATYEFSYGLSPKTIARKFVDQFEQRWTTEYTDRAKEIGFTKLQVVTLASIIEREVRFREELPLVSSVYHNRLKKRMYLQADPTVQYALGYWKPRLTYDDYKNTKSPYNTYLGYGLPPGPISNPGWDAVKAALWPAQTNALFFVAMEDGHHNFSESYRDHTNKVNKRNRQRK